MSAREAAVAVGVHVVTGSDSLASAAEAESFLDQIGSPVILKAAMGGGGKGMCVVRKQNDLVPIFESTSSEALAAFGDGSVFAERYVERPRHIEVHVIGDGQGNVVHLRERDCSMQRSYEKVVEMALAWSLTMELRDELHKYAVELTSAAKYKHAGTMEFLVDGDSHLYFIKINTRIQVSERMRE